MLRCGPSKGALPAPASPLLLALQQRQLSSMDAPSRHSEPPSLELVTSSGWGLTHLQGWLLPAEAVGVGAGGRSLLPRLRLTGVPSHSREGRWGPARDWDSDLRHPRVSHLPNKCPQTPLHAAGPWPPFRHLGPLRTSLAKIRSLPQPRLPRWEAFLKNTVFFC